MKQVTEIPEWFTRMSLEGKLNSKDIQILFGFSKETSIEVLCKQGSFPKPEAFISSKTKFTTDGISKKCYWSKKVILQEIQRRRRLQMQHQEIKEVFLVQNEFQNTIKAFTSLILAEEWMEVNKHFVHLGELLILPVDTETSYGTS